MIDLDACRDPRRWSEVLLSFLETWLGPHRPEYGIPPSELEGLALPGPLAWWYRTVGRWPGAVGRQNEILAPDETRVEDDRLVFAVENQAVVLWSTSTAGDDAPVWVRTNDAGAGWELEEPPLSAFLLQFCIVEAAMSASLRSSAICFSPERIKDVLAHFRELPLGHWRWPVHSTSFHVNDVALAACASDESGYGDLWVAATGPRGREFLLDITDDSWDYVSPRDSP